MKKIILGLLFTLGALVGHAAPPVINDYDSTIIINKNSSIIVKEIINVTTDGVRIQRGIYRDFPTHYKTLQGFNYDLGFKLISVDRDDRPEEYHIKQLSNGIRIYIGNSKTYLPPSTYTYQITYLVNGALGFFASHDELYWNVTGNAWSFPILKTSATVILPQDVKITNTTAYTGAQLSTEKNYQKKMLSSNEAYFTTSKELLPNQGFTVVVAWPKGLIKPPTILLKIKNFIQANHHLSFAFIGYIVLIGFYIMSWFYLGQDPKTKVIIPLFEPPSGFSPQALGYIKNMQFDDKLFTAAIINMAVKNYLTIKEKTNKKYLLTKIGSDDSLLTPPEQAICEELFRITPTILVDSANNEFISKAVRRFKEKLAKEFQQKYFNLNTPIIILGIALSAMSLLPLIIEQFGYLLTLSIFAVFGYFFVEPFIPHKIKEFKTFCLSALSIMLLGLILGIIFLPLIFESLVGANWLSYLIVALFLTTNSLFMDLMRRPTPLGMDIITQTLGFELFLKATEETRMNFRNPPDKTPELFERYLPFALALGLEQEWSQQFSQILAQSQYQPDWYSGTNYNFSNNSFSKSIGTSFTNAVCSASIAPNSSSGFDIGSGGGGGFSGGGFGGGGGGGW